MVSVTTICIYVDILSTSTQCGEDEPRHGEEGGEAAPGAWGRGRANHQLGGELALGGAGVQAVVPGTVASLLIISL